MNTLHNCFLNCSRGLCLLLSLVAPWLVCANDQTTRTNSSKPEERTAHALQKAAENPLDLRAFLVRMPKGGDLHNHIFGAIYAETWIAEAIEDHLCVDSTNFRLAKPAGDDASSKNGSCAPGQVPAAQALTDQHLYDAMVDAFSMRSFVPSTGINGHDHFFSTFDKFGMMDLRHLGAWLEELSSRAAAQNEQYLELMHTPDFSHIASAATALGWHGEFSAMRSALLQRGVASEVSAVRASLDAAEAERNRRQNCGTPKAQPGCGVQIRYLYQFLRGFPPEIVFAQMLQGFETAAADPRVVGINIVMPEDGYVARSNYALHMRMMDFFHATYPTVHISLHAGEIAPGFVPYEDLRFHIRQAVEIGHAERIGHGVSVMYEDRPYELLREMAEKHVAVEVNFTSNDVILGITGNQHPFELYRRYKVPIALDTDDEGVSRVDMTHEFARGVETYHLEYGDLKEVVRNSIEYSFLPGSSLWSANGDYRHIAPSCAHDLLGAGNPGQACADFLKSNEKARQQWELESRFAAFEQQF